MKPLQACSTYHISTIERGKVTNNYLTKRRHRLYKTNRFKRSAYCLQLFELFSWNAEWCFIHENCLSENRNLLFYRLARIIHIKFDQISDSFTYSSTNIGILNSSCKNWMYKLFLVLTSVTTQCLVSWFSCPEISWIFEISCQDLGNYSWESSQDFARFFKIVESNPRKFLDFLARKPRVSKILASSSTRELWKKSIVTTASSRSFWR